MSRSDCNFIFVCVYFELIDELPTNWSAWLTSVIECNTVAMMRVLCAFSKSAEL